MRVNHSLLPMQDYHKSKRLTWDPQDIRLDLDRVDWPKRTPDEQESTLTLISLFHAGEEAVTHDLSPLLLALRREGGHLEEEIFLTAQLFEESRHFEFFDRWIDEVHGPGFEDAQRLGPSYCELFFRDLPAALDRLLVDPSAAAQAEAVVIYHMIVEGVLAETGYHSVFDSLQDQQVLPGLAEGMGYIKRDEARHIAFGVYLLQRLVQADGRIWDVVQAKMNEMLPKALGVVDESLAKFGDHIPYGIRMDDLLQFATSQYTARMSAIQRAVVH